MFSPSALTRVADGLIDWIQRQVAAGGGGMLFGLSGGVDSALLAALARRALGDNCRALILPCQSAPADEADAWLVARQVGINTFTVNLDDSFEQMLALLAAAHPGPPSGQDEPSSAVVQGAQSNLKPRLRMLVMYYYANLWGWLVAGTTNRDELTVGYFTKYGDGAVDLLPLAGLLKDEIWALSRHLGLPEEVVAKPPSAGLWEGQTDEEEMGFNYAQLDAYLRNEPVPATVARRVEALKAGSTHKRRRPPQGPTWAELMSEQV